MGIIRAVLGRPLANREAAERKIGMFEGVPAMGLDALASAAYGPEAALTILMPLGAAGIAYLGHVMVPILLLFGLLYVSYRQTIRAYPSNGGAYTVSKQNLGAHASLLAASGLMVDYVLNVAVGISAGVAALTSAIPELHPDTLILCLAILALITLANLRGTPDAGRLFGPPAYLFVAIFAGLLAVGVWKAAMASGHAVPVVAPPAVPRATETLSAWLALRAFASGCTAMTGVEAVSNGVDAFREPVTRNGHRTLSFICGALALLLIGVAITARAYGVGAMDQSQAGYQTVLSQLTAAIAGRGVVYYVAVGSLLAVLALSANTSFVAFPRLCRLVAQDEYLPRPFATVGRRLVFSVGILYLAATAGTLLIVFGGITDRLIPLFAIGAFLTFTLSQTGMVVHWRRELREHRRPFDRGRLAVNALGAAATAVALVIIVVAKFAEGAWITLLVVPAVIVLLIRIKRYYVHLEGKLRGGGALDLRNVEAPIVLVVLESWSRAARSALSFAIHLSPDVVAVHLTELEGPDQPEHLSSLRHHWKHDVTRPAEAARLKPPELIFLPAPFRNLREPLLKLIAKTEQRHPDRLIAVLIPDLIKRTWWEHLLHTHRTARLRTALLHYGGSRTVVIDLPWYLEEPNIAEGLAEEDRAAETVGTRT